MDIETAHKTLEECYGPALAKVMKENLKDLAITRLAQAVTDGKPKQVDAKTVKLLKNYDERSQAGWLTNPMVENLIQGVLAQYMANLTGGGAVAAQTTVTESAAPAKPVEPEEEDEPVDMGIGLFGDDDDDW